MQNVVELKGRTLSKRVQAELGQSLLDLAKKHRIDWGFSCTRGNCARCRCYVEEGREHLSEVNDIEFRRLQTDEIEEGYRLGCQAVIKSEGHIKAINRTYWSY